MSKWLNNKKQRHKSEDVAFPCEKLDYCPYGQLVEEFPLHEGDDKISCPTFGHDCPVYYHAEGSYLAKDGNTLLLNKKGERA